MKLFPTKELELKLTQPFRNSIIYKKKKNMKIVKSCFGIILGVLIFIGCSKKEDDLVSQNCETNCTEIVGKIMTDHGSTPITNLELTVIWDNTPHLGGGVIRTKAITRTDDQGNFNLKFFIRDDELEAGGFRLSYEQLDSNDYLRTDLNGISLLQIARDTTLTVNHNVPKKAFLNLTLLNLDQVQQGSSFSTEFSYPRPTGFSQSIDGQVNGWNSQSEQNNLLEIAGNQPIELKIYRNINGVQSTEIQNISFAAGTTSNYSIDFIIN